MPVRYSRTHPALWQWLNSSVTSSIIPRKESRVPKMAKAFKRFAISTLVAGAAGYLAGILTAPKSGQSTRKDIKDAADNTISEGERQLKKLHTELNDLLGEVKKRGKSA